MSSIQLHSLISGDVQALSNVPDPVFAEEMLGPGFAIQPWEGWVSAPFSGVVKQLASTGHSITLRSNEGAELLIHIGVDTVALKGKGFSTRVAEGDAVQAGQRLIDFDLDFIEANAVSAMVVCVLLNSEEFTWQWNQVMPYAVDSVGLIPVVLNSKGDVSALAGAHGVDVYKRQPLGTLIVEGLHGDKLTEAAGLSNFLRTLGGAIGTAVFTTLWARRTTFHHARLTEIVTTGAPGYEQLMAQLQRAGGSAEQRLTILDGLISQQAATQSTLDVLRLTAGLFLLMIVFVFFAKPVKGATASGGH